MPLGADQKPASQNLEQQNKLKLNAGCPIWLEIWYQVSYRSRQQADFRQRGGLSFAFSVTLYRIVASRAVASEYDSPSERSAIYYDVQFPRLLAQPTPLSTSTSGFIVSQYQLLRPWDLNIVPCWLSHARQNACIPHESTFATILRESSQPEAIKLAQVCISIYELRIFCTVQIL